MAYDVTIYLDEYTLSKVKNNPDFINYATSLISLIKIFNGSDVKITISRNVTFEGIELDLHKVVSSAIQEILPSDIRLQFKKIIYDKYNSNIWSHSPKHSCNEYFEFNNDCITENTLAEATEEVILNGAGVLAYIFNFSSFGETIKITKEENIFIDITTLNTNLDCKKWLDKEYDVCTFQYDLTSKTPPTDLQTYLRDHTSYIKTEKINQGRFVYSCVLTRQMHTVDNLHYGEKSHVEVWDKHGIYLGEADIKGILCTNIDPKKKRRKNNPQWN